MSITKYIAPLWILLAVFLIMPFVAGAQMSSREQSRDAVLETAKARLMESSKTEAVKPSIFENVRTRLEKNPVEIKSDAREKVETRAVEKRIEENSSGARLDTLVNEKKRIENQAVDSARKVEEKKAEVLQKQTAREEQTLEKRQNAEERQKELLEKRKERVAAYFEKMFNRLDAAVERLHVLAERIDSRIKKFEERKVDVTEAKQALEKAKSLIENARVSLAEAKASIQNILSGENPKDIFADAQKSVKAVVSHIKEAHAALVQSIVALKGNSEAEKIENAAPAE